MANSNYRYKLKINELLKETGISQNELAKKLNVNQKTICNACKEETKSLTETHLKIAAYFNMDIKELFDVTDVTIESSNP